MMETRSLAGIQICYDSQEEETADLIERACERALELCRAIWGLEAPADCHIYVMTAWFPFFFRSSPWSWRIMLALVVPFWAPRARRTWPISAAWTQRYGKRVAIGVKPPRLLDGADRSASLGIFVQEPDMDLNVQQVTCHELVHACSAHLRLPAWLNEGIATVTADRFMGRPTIRSDSLELVRRYEPKGPPLTYRAMSKVGIADAFKYQAVRGYWLTRYIEGIHPGFLAELFSRQPEPSIYKVLIAGKLGMDLDTFWREIDTRIVDYFPEVSV